MISTSNISIRKRNLGFLAFFFSGICAMSAGVIVSLLQEQYGFAYGMTGTLLSVMNIGNLAAAFAAGTLPRRLGTKNTVFLLCSGYAAGYLLMVFDNLTSVLMLAFLLLGLAKGCALNSCTVMVSENTQERTKGMNLMHACYACGALLGPILISASLFVGKKLPMVALAAVGLFLWLTFAAARLENIKTGKKEKINWSFLKETKFWLLTGLIFCQNAAETSVTGWMVTYYKGNDILSGALSSYTITIMWGATLIARVLIAFVLPIKNRFRALAVMGAGCVVLYAGLIIANNGAFAMIMLFLFSFAMAGVNPTAVAGAGSLISASSLGIMLPLAATGGIIMPAVIGMVAETVSLQAGMLCNIIPCAGILLLSLICARFEIRNERLEKGKYRHNLEFLNK